MALVVCMGIVSAQEDIHENIKHTLRPNMTHQYDEIPPSVDSFSDWFTEGDFYGRLRFNSFGFKWKEELEINGIDVRKDHAIAAIGGSLIYHSAYLNGFFFGGGLYATTSQGTLKREEAYLYKAGKDTFSRYDRLTDGTVGILSLAEAYMAYKVEHTEFKAGRQIFESFLTKSNDTKMIPNTFEGLTMVSRDLPHTVLKAAYLTKQKLRDHSEFHHIFAYGYEEGVPYSAYTENDDSMMHVGITRMKLEERGIDDRLVIADLKNTGVENLTLSANYTAVPELLSSAMMQVDYAFEAGEWHIIPSVRYMQQFDNGAGEIGGASRKGVTVGYRDPKSLDSWLLGVRVDVVQENLKFRAAYTRVADEGDIIAPWRGFPTGGFTRAMGQYNWYANTKTFMFQVDYETQDFYNIRTVARFALQDFDDNKAAVQADSNVFTLDIMQGFDGTLNIYTKLRYAHVMGKDDTPIPGTGLFKTDPSYDEVRLEINYLF